MHRFFGAPRDVLANGRASRIVIDSPSTLSPEAVRCIGDKLAVAEVPPFRGAPMTVGETWYVK